jgi:hypothetical protein
VAVVPVVGSTAAVVEAVVEVVVEVVVVVGRAAGVGQLPAAQPLRMGSLRD